MSGPAPAPRAVQVVRAGLVPYRAALAWQRELAAARIAGRLRDDLLLLVEHPPVVTLGRTARAAHVLRDAGIEVVEVERGGDVTYHGPGQILGYPIVDLREWKRDVGAYVRAVEQTIIDALSDFGIASERIPKLTGVWTQTENDTHAKIAAIGVHLSRWVSTHGWALNVTTDLRYFQYIVPCGLTKPVTSMAAVRAPQNAPDAEDVKRALAQRFGQNFDFEMQAEAPALTGRV